MHNLFYQLVSGSWAEIYFGSLILILTIMNPFAVLAIFLGVTNNFTTHEKKTTSIKSCYTIAIVLVVSIWCGNLILKFFGVNLPSFEVAGGILLFLFCLPMVKPQTTKPIEQHDGHDSLNEDISFVPLAIPMVSGPAAILQVLLCLQIYGNDIHTKFVLTFSALTGVAIVFCFFYFSDTILKIIGINGLRIIKILIGIILLSIAVEVIARGTLSLLNMKPKHQTHTVTDNPIKIKY